MSEFASPLVLIMLPDRQWSVYEKFECHVGELEAGIVIRVEKGFQTDLASIPVLFGLFFHCMGVMERPRLFMTIVTWMPLNQKNGRIVFFVNLCGF